MESLVTEKGKPFEIYRRMLYVWREECFRQAKPFKEAQNRNQDEGRPKIVSRPEMMDSVNALQNWEHF